MLNYKKISRGKMESLMINRSAEFQYCNGLVYKIVLDNKLKKGKENAYFQHQN